jgi:hypothetical protein
MLARGASADQAPVAAAPVSGGAAAPPPAAAGGGGKQTKKGSKPGGAEEPEKTGGGGFVRSDGCARILVLVLTEPCIVRLDANADLWGACDAHSSD